MGLNVDNDIVQLWMQEVLNNRGKNAQLTFKYCEDIIEYAKENKDDALLGFAYYYCAETYYCLNDGENFFRMVAKALAYQNRAQQWELMAKSYNFMGISAMNRGNAPIALDYYLNGLNLCKEHHYPDLEALINSNVATLNLQTRRYTQAQEFLEKAYNYVHKNPHLESYHSSMLCIYTNLAKSLFCQNKYEEADAVFKKIYAHHWKYADELERIAVGCAEALYYHKIGNIAQRDACIENIQSNIIENVAIMDIFDDYYDYCMMLLDCDDDASFWKIVETMEPLVRSLNIYNLHLRIISLKIKFYRKNNQSAEFLQAAGLYYNISELMEQENRNMINSVLNLRRNLEQANKERIMVQAQNQILIEKSETDPLTNLANRFRLNDYSEAIFEKAQREQIPLTVEILDIDYFKEFNDNYGHQQGDRCLSAIADVLKSLMKEYGAFCARYGGDEFIIIYEGISKEQARSLASELKRRIMELSIEHHYSKALPIVTISQGLCWDIPTEGNRMWDFLHAADEMLYKVKTFSRNNYCLGELTQEGIIGDLGNSNA